MSAEATPVTAAHHAYLAARTLPEDEVLRGLREHLAGSGQTPMWIAPEQGAFLSILLRIAGAREVVEVGTMGGYSAIWMARALPEGGRVRTIELDPDRADTAREWAAKAGLGDACGEVVVLEGRGADVLPTLETDSADAAFLDADKVSLPIYAAEAKRIVKPGGLVMIDNAFAFGQLLDDSPTDPEVPDVRAFNDATASDSDLDGVIVGIGDGVWVAVNGGGS